MTNTATTETAENATEATQNNSTSNATTPVNPTTKNKSSAHKMDYEKDVVYLYQFGRFPTIPSASPFCLKVETWLRMAGVKYENVDHKMKYKSKKGQLPFIEVNGSEIADSDIIIKELSKQFYKDLDSDMTTDQKIVGHAFISMLNNHTSWVMRWWRYSHPGQFLKTANVDIKRTLNSKLPKGLLQFIFKLGLKSNVKTAVGHGMGRHTAEEIVSFGKEDLKALSDFLSEKQFFFGSEPHLLDCVAFAHLCQFIYVPFGDMKDYLENDCGNLVSFVGRMKDRFWPDWDEMCKSLELNTHLPKKEDKKEEEQKEKVDEKDKKEADDESKDKTSEPEDKDKDTEKNEIKDESEKPKEPETPQDNKEKEEAKEKEEEKKE